jgi:subtilisin family serine protease
MMDAETPRTTFPDHDIYRGTRHRVSDTYNAHARAPAGSVEMSKSRTASATRRRRSNEPGARRSTRGAQSKNPARSISEQSGSSQAARDSKKPESRRFLPEVLDRTVIALPLLNWFKDPKKQGQLFDIVVDLNLNFRGGLKGARKAVEERIDKIVRTPRTTGKKRRMSRSVVDEDMQDEGVQYVFATLDAESIKDLARRDSGQSPEDRAIHHIWPDFPLKTLINKSISTVKADAAYSSFAAGGAGIVWAVVDSGIDGSHSHFVEYKNLKLTPPLHHRDFTGGGAPLEDIKGHGTHVAGIIAGQFNTNDKERGNAKRRIVATTRYRDHDGEPAETEVTPPLTLMSGMAPACKLLSLKVLDGPDDDAVGTVRGVMAALQYIQRLNSYGRRLLVHGVNLSVGYDFEPEWFACGQSPLCVEVDRLVRSGVVVVVAAGNSGFGVVTSQDGPSSAGLSLTINDPGNAELAITVGSTHRDMPHTYGVSYFSSKGPTGDGRIKPDLVAPGEKVISCESRQKPEAVRRSRAARAGVREITARYCEGSGTSQAAPHVSGVIAAFLSIRREFLQRPEEVKRIFMSTATDLNRERYFQGRGLVDVMRAIQSV